MSDDAKLILGIGITVVVALIGVVWWQLNERISAILDQIGRSGEQGMRKMVHDDNRKISEAVAGQESMKEDIERLMRKVFNGTHLR